MITTTTPPIISHVFLFIAALKTVLPIAPSAPSCALSLRVLVTFSFASAASFSASVSF